MNQDLLLTIHSLAGYDQRRAIEEIMGWPLIPHALPQCDLLPPLFSNDIFEKRGYCLNVFVPSHDGKSRREIYAMTFIKVWSRWVRQERMRWREVKPSTIHQRLGGRSTYQYLHYFFNDSHGNRCLLSNIYVSADVILETHDFYDPKDYYGGWLNREESTGFVCWMGNRQGQWTGIPFKNWFEGGSFLRSKFPIFSYYFPRMKA